MKKKKRRRKKREKKKKKNNKKNIDNKINEICNKEIVKLIILILKKKITKII